MTKPSTAPHILQLPNELLLQIAQDLSLPTLISLNKTCRRAYKSLTHQLYARAVRDDPRRRSNGQLSLASMIGRIGSLSAVHHCMEHQPLDNEDGQVFRATCLREAAAHGHSAVVRYLLDAGVDPDRPSGSPIACRPIFAAAENNHVDIVEMLLATGVQLGPPEDVRDCPLNAAMVRTHHPSMALVQMLLEKRRYPTAHFTTLLYAVAGAGRADLAELMLDVGAEIDARDAEGRTPLCLAIEQGHYDTIEMLLRRGANIAKVDNGGATPLSLAVENRETNTAAVVKLLVEHGADPNERCPDGKTPLHVATTSDGGKGDIVLALLEVGAAWSAIGGRFGTTPLLNAMQSTREPRPSIQHLIDYGAADYAPHYTPALFYWAARLGYDGIVKRYIEHGGNVEADCISAQRSATKVIFRAVASGREALLKMVLPLVTDIDWKSRMHGSAVTEAARIGTALCLPDIEFLNSLGETPLIVACQQNRVEVAEGLLKRGADIEAKKAPSKRKPLMIACEMGLERLATMLLAHEADPYAQYHGRPNIAVAASHGHTDIVKMLVEHGVPVDLTNSMLQTPLIMAAKTGHAEVIDALHGADIDHVDIKGRSALSYAAEVKGGSTMQSLLDRGADPNLPDVQGRTPLTWAVIAGNIEGVTVLVDAGADTTHGDKDGYTPIGHAMRLGDEIVIKALYRRYYNRSR
ncbi:ankyrin repeat-containing domain protein [Aspergillus floccosus]